jgi:hypothetical protein
MFSVDSTVATGSLEHNDNLAIQGVSVACDSYTKQRLLPQNAFTDRFLGAFVKLRKATISFVLSVPPSACNISAPTGRIFVKFYI